MSSILLIALIPPFLWAVVNHLDKYAVDRYMQRRDPGALILFTGLAALVIGIVVYLLAPIEQLPLRTSFVMIAAGMLLVFSYIPYLYALSSDEASNVAPLFQLITPCAYVLALVFLGERLSFAQLVAGAMILTGALRLSFDLGSMHLRRRTFLLMLLSSIMIAANIVIFKSFALSTSFWTTVFYDLLGAVVAGTILLALVARYRKDFFGAIKEHGLSVVAVNLSAETLSIGARMIAGFVTLAIPIAVVQFVNSIQSVFILVIGIILTKFAPHLGIEAIDRRSLSRKFSAIILMCAGLALLTFFV